MDSIQGCVECAHPIDPLHAAGAFLAAFFSPAPAAPFAIDHQVTSKRRTLMAICKQEERRFLSGLNAGVPAPEIG